ncbi:MAG: S46 family peptidase [Bacteroidota bacterium]|jgi:hypothetical protein
MKLLNRYLVGAALIGSICLLFLNASPPRPDEGMWTFDNPPLKLLKQKYGFEPTQQWLDHIRLASVRFNDGGSGSFVSADGLTLTNHHVARGQLQKMSTQEKDYVKDGFYARTSSEEIKCPDLELNVLQSLDNVTDRITKAVSRAKTDNEALEMRKAESAKIEKESLKKTGLRSDVITLYNGGEYWLYRYKKYTDVRLVFAPEAGAAFYGGDPDNFTYPRYDLDMALFRVYENDKPIHPEHFLQWSEKGADDGELVFASGNPGSTQRSSTMAQLEFIRDHNFPTIIKALKRRIDALKQYSKGGKEETRQAASLIFGLENSLKASQGEYEGLLDRNIMAKKQKEETEFRAKINANPQWQKDFGDAWDTIAAAKKRHSELFKPMFFRGLRGSRMAQLALLIVQYVSEVKKPDGERLEGFHDSQLESFKFNLFSPAPVYPKLEEFRLTDGLHESIEELGNDDPFVKTVLNGKSPADFARELFAGTKLADPEFRKSLVEGGEKAVQKSTDPMIVAARAIDPMVREMRKTYEKEVEAIETVAGEKIGKAGFAVYGKSTYPDANFTLRLTYGKVSGYSMNGTIAPPKTTFYGLYDRANSFNMQPPFDLAQRYIDRKDKLDLTTPLNFVASLDVVGGNSGSPIINRKGELVGLVFDGNIESLVGTYVYDEEKNRTVGVHSQAMIEALRKLYDAGPLADELQGKNVQK